MTTQSVSQVMNSCTIVKAIMELSTLLVVSELPELVRALEFLEELNDPDDPGTIAEKVVLIRNVLVEEISRREEPNEYLD